MPVPIETPAVLVDLDLAERNIQRFQDHCDRYGLAVRPHVKTHKLPLLAHAQLAAGAVGITCQKIGEAEVMAEAGVDDILITYNILGETKRDRLAALSGRGVRLTVTADHPAVVDGLSETYSRLREPLRVLVECDTGAGRCGVQAPGDALELARRIEAAPGLVLGGLMTYPPMGDQAPVERWLASARAALVAEGLACPVISSGGTPNMWRCQDVSTATEHRAGTYVYNDRSLVASGVCTVDDCALIVLATVVSRPTDTRAILDCGSKVLTSDLLGLEGYGLVVGRPQVQIVRLSEEHGTMDLTGSDWQPSVGERLRIVPNHACVVSNMVDAVWGLRNGSISGQLPVAARGKVT